MISGTAHVFIDLFNKCLPMNGLICVLFQGWTFTFLMSELQTLRSDICIFVSAIMLCKYSCVDIRLSLKEYFSL